MGIQIPSTAKSGVHAILVSTRMNHGEYLSGYVKISSRPHDLEVPLFWISNPKGKNNSLEASTLYRYNLEADLGRLFSTWRQKPCSRSSNDEIFVDRLLSRLPMMSPLFT